MIPRRRPIRVALTGGIATGKTYCRQRFEARGVPTIDADVLARRAVEAGTPGFDDVVGRFGTGVIAADGSLDRPRLGAMVFADDRARRDLEAIVHPRVYEAITAWMDAQTDRDPAPDVVVADIPLLFETGHAGDFDRVVVAACPEAMQVARLTGERGLTEMDARQRLAAQWPIERKRALADFVIDTSESFGRTDADVDRVIGELVAESRRLFA